MDPITKEINRFQENFRKFKMNPEARILHVITEPTQVQDITGALRAEEWRPENRCPFLIFDTAYLTKDSAFEEMCESLREHYDLLKEGLEEQDIRLSDFNVPLKGKKSPDFIFALYIQEFRRLINQHFNGLMVCWLPTRIDNSRRWQKSVVELVTRPLDPSIRFVIADDGNKVLDKEFKNNDRELVTVTFSIDNKAAQDYFKKLMGYDGSEESDTKPSVPGVPLGAARPDVPPPPRKVGTRQPTEEELRKAVEEGDLPPVLTPSEGEELRDLIMKAAMASGEGRAMDAVRFQQMACDLCHKAGVQLEEVVMIMLFATYLQQAEQTTRTIEEYKRALTLAESIEAYAQVNQIHMSLGYIYLKDKLYDLSAIEYENAAQAANKLEDPILGIEALRMAGTCYLQMKDRDQAERCWRQAVELGRTAMPEQIKLSSFMDVAEALIELLRKMRLKDQALHIEQLVMEVGERSRSSKEDEEV